MPDRLRVAVIGAGVMGQHHIRVYSELPGVDLVAIADTHEAAIAGSSTRGYQDHRRLLDEESLDAVSIAVPARAHHDVAIACLERGIAVLVEKPIAATASEAGALREAAERANVPLMAGHIERFNPAVRELK
ncbi:MAG TPA: Gfo/Idh/MocA family oxidoreductase, partial [Dehalococcoidia bacterium]